MITSNKNIVSIKMVFIHYSKERNIRMEEFLYWNHIIQYFTISQQISPQPIIFNIETIQETKRFFFDIKPAGSIVNDTNLLYYCINKEMNANLLENLSVLEGKNYKFKLNPEKIIA